jgi:hypothetical protein
LSFPTLPWERKFRLDLGGGRGTGTGETRGRVCKVAGVGSEGFVNQKRDSTSIIGRSRGILVGSAFLHLGLIFVFSNQIIIQDSQLRLRFGTFVASGLARLN